jgi:hypothetical protein
MAIRTSFLAGKRDANLAWMSQPHGTVWSHAAGTLTERGVDIRRGAKVEEVVFTAGAEGPVGLSAVRLTGEERLPVAGVIAAVPPGVLRGLLPPDMREREPFSVGTSLEWSPILNLHAWFAQPVTTEPLLAVLNSPLQWIFVKPGQDPEEGRIPVPATAQHLNLVISASGDFLGRSDGESTALLLDELGSVLPATRTTTLLATRLVHETRATFSAIPGSERHRPSQQTPVPRFALAGAWTATGWPSTLEGAVRSGRAAVHALGVRSS